MKIIHILYIIILGLVLKIFLYFLNSDFLFLLFVLNNDYDYFNELDSNNFYIFFKNNNLLRESVKNSNGNINYNNHFFSFKEVKIYLKLKWEKEIYKWKLRKATLKWFLGKRN